MNFLSLKITNQDHPSHSTDGETETQEKSRNQITVIYLFIEITVTSGCPFILCLPSRNAKTSASMDSYNTSSLHPGQAH